MPEAFCSYNSLLPVAKSTRSSQVTSRRACLGKSQSVQTQRVKISEVFAEEKSSQEILRRYSEDGSEGVEAISCIASCFV